MERRMVMVRGIVQGVGFRPHVYRLARDYRLGGSVCNTSGSVHIEIEGDPRSLDRFCRELVSRPPPLAAISELSSRVIGCRGDTEFRIGPSAESRSADVFIAPDVATCPECLRELFDRANRRFRYPFLNCTNCGPRLTIVRGAPYDRPLTTMAAFTMCAQCRAEYEDPLDRRYHAQPTCCPACGPRLRLFTDQRDPIVGADPIDSFAKALRSMKIGALKGLGGYHLVCDATCEVAVGELRRRKGRDDKPLAVMVADVAAAGRLCHIGSAERALLADPARPIVLLRRRDNLAVAANVAPENPYLGLMLPYTPLHYLLLDVLGGTPLVMTSGNRSEEPIAYEDDAAFEQLDSIADLFLIHDRPIHVRCDDSVTRIVGEQESPLRRSRGYAPRPIELSIASARPLLAVGGQLKSTFALGRGTTAILSHHLGDLDDYRAYRAFERDIALYEDLFDVRPQVLVHDLHPDYASTGYATRRAAREGLETIGVQHHHAHVAACMAEHGLRGDVIGVAFDGTGYGSDGAIWGGEFLVADYAGFRRAAHLRYVPLAGGDQAIRQPWRSALAHALDAGCDLSQIPILSEQADLRPIRQMIERGINSPPTSSAGRLFDAVAALLGIRRTVTFEGQAAMELEWLASDGAKAEPYPFLVEPTASTGGPGCLEIDTRPLVMALVHDAGRGIDPRGISRRFHATLAEIIARVCNRIREQIRLDRVVLSGGVFQNALLSKAASARLGSSGFTVFQHALVPANDGGISLGQLMIGAAHANRTHFNRQASRQG